MADPFAKVRTGQPLKIPAQAWNAMLDAAKANQNSHQTAGTAPRDVIPGQIVQVQNNSGGDLPVYSILGVDGTLYEPDPAVNATLLQPIYKGVTPIEPDHLSAFVVILAPIKDGQTGPAVIDGVCMAKISVTDDSQANTVADITDGQTGYLLAGVFGSAGVLWREGGTGTQWAVIRLGVSGAVKPYKLTPCSVVDGTGNRYTSDDLKKKVGKIVKIDGKCYLVSVPTDEEVQCVVPECNLSVSGAYTSCCKCHGYVKLTLQQCDDAEADPITATVQATAPAIGAFVRIEGVCYQVTAVSSCDTDAGDPLPGDLVFTGCEDCQGSCWQLTLCNDTETQNVRSPNLSLGDVIFLSGSYFTSPSAQ